MAINNIVNHGGNLAVAVGERSIAQAGSQNVAMLNVDPAAWVQVQGAVRRIAELLAEPQAQQARTLVEPIVARACQLADHKSPKEAHGLREMLDAIKSVGGGIEGAGRIVEACSQAIELLGSCIGG